MVLHVRNGGTLSKITGDYGNVKAGPRCDSVVRAGAGRTGLERGVSR